MPYSARNRTAEWNRDVNRCSRPSRRPAWPLGPLLLAMTALMVTAAASAAAQESSSDPPDALATEPRACVWGGPLPECASFFIFELRGQAPFAQTGRQVTQGLGPESNEVFVYDEHAYAPTFGWELGYAWNLNQRYAAGATVGLEVGGPETRFYVRARGRRWLNPRLGLSLEVAPGVFVAANEYSDTGVGGTADVRINMQDRLALVVRYDVLKQNALQFPYLVDPGGVQHAFSVGAVLGSKPALLGTGGLGLTYAILLGIFLSTYD